MSYEIIGKFSRIRARLLARVLLLLLLPMAQAIHLTEHQVISSDYQCVICHANNSLEDAKVNDIQQLIAEYQPLTLVQDSLNPFDSYLAKRHNTIRGPPTL